MSFPTITAPTVTKFATSYTSMVVNLPASITAGKLLLAFVEVRNTGTFTPPSGWTQFFTQAGGSSVGRLTGFYKIATGSEGATATWVASFGTSAIWRTYMVDNWHGTTPPEAASAAGDYTTGPNSPSLSPSWGADDTLWLSIAANTASATFVNGAPSGYGNYSKDTASSGGAQVQMAHSDRQLNAASEDPGAFSIPSNVRYWAAVTVAIRPGAGGEPPASTANFFPFIKV